MTATKNADPPSVWETLRASFPAELVSKLPRVTCGACRDATKGNNGRPWNTCQRHSYEWCDDCQQKHSTGAIHLDYVGHADTTDRLLQADPYWTWEPVARDVDKDLLAAAIATGDKAIVDALIEHSPPKPDAYGGLWIKMTVHDGDGEQVTRLGYGDAQGKPAGPNAVKEVIGDAIRNAAMRFGVALDLWSKADRSAPDDDGGEQAEPNSKANGQSNGQARRQQQGNGNRTHDADPPKDRPAGGDAADGTSQIDPKAQEIADAIVYCESVEALQKIGYQPAREQKRLRHLVADPEGGDIKSLSDVIQRVKAEIAKRAEEAQQAEKAGAS
jgi:hypothetical protein